MNALRGLPPALHRVATLEAICPRITYRVGLAPGNSRAVAFLSPTIPLSGTSNVVTARADVPLVALVETIEDRFTAFREATVTGTDVALALLETDTPNVGATNCRYITFATAAAAAAVGMVVPQLGTPCAALVPDDNAAAAAVARIARDCKTPLAATLAGRAAILDIDSSLREMARAPLPTRMTYGHMYRPTPVEKVNSAFVIDAMSTSIAGSCLHLSI